MKKDQIFEFFRRLAEANPSPETELEYGNVYQLLVAVTLSAQATDVGVNKATRALFAKVKTSQDMLDLGEEGLKAHIKTIAHHTAGLDHAADPKRSSLRRFVGSDLGRGKEKHDVRIQRVEHQPDRDRQNRQPDRNPDEALAADHRSG